MPLLEVCVDSIAGLRAAQAEGADRIELCSRLDLGGLSPGPDLLARAFEIARVPVCVMVRPRSGDFVYDEGELARMRVEVRALRGTRAAGVVLGVLTREGRVNAAAIGKLAALARPLSVTFHRAFDAARDPMEAIEVLAALSVDRVLSAGGPGDAFEGRTRLRALVEKAAGRIVVMAGGGVRPANAAAILADSGVSELHGSVPFRC